MPDRWQRLQDAVESASELEDGTAAAALEASLGDDAELLDEARRILAAGRRGDGFLEPAPRREHPRGCSLAQGARLGPFEIVEELGHGGMGTVFLARQATPQRTVALKVLNRPLASDEARARFRYEVQALASLRHRGIAQIHQAGVDVVGDGPLQHETPWFAMEYVEGGQSILAFAAAHALDTAARLRLFAEVCEAVHHGHQRGIVHRDLKPDNLLVNAAGHPKVIDFGVARVSDPEAVLTTLRAGTGEIAGTLPYMSPEQIAGKDQTGDVRGDVYALGVVLYELLVGALPITVDSTDFVTSARRICDEAPRRPSAVRKALRGDLETILLKALAKDPGRRYASADALAADIARFLDRRPIEARPPSAAYQLRMFARRHRVLVGATGLVVLVSLAAALVSFGFAVRSRDAERTALAQKAEAIEQKERSDKLFQTLLTRTFASTTRLAPQIHELQGGVGPVKELMASVMKDIAVLESLAAGDPRVRVLLAEAYMRMGDTQGNRFYRNLDDIEGARNSYDKAIAVLADIPESDPKFDAAKRAELRARRKLAELVPPGKMHELAHAKPALEAVQRELAELAARRPERKASVVTDLALIHFRLAEVARVQRDFDTSATHLRETIRIATSVGDQDLATDAKTALADDLLFDNRAAEALPIFEEVIATLDKRARADDAPYSVRFGFAVILGRHGGAAELTGHPESAERSWTRAASILGDVFADDPRDRRVLIQLHMVLTWLSKLNVRRAQQEGVSPEERRRLLTAAAGAYEQAAETLERAEGGGPKREATVARLRARAAAIEDELDAE